MKSFLIHDDCWDADVWILYPCDEPALTRFVEKKFKKILEPDEKPGFLGRFVSIEDDDGNSLGHVIALSKWRNSPANVAILVHEALHVTHSILSDRGVELNDDTSEAFAYLLDSLVRRCLERLNKK